jgi:hypothetical protein
MKLNCILVLCCLFAVNAPAQTLPNLDLVKLEVAADYGKAEPFVLQTANYLLNVKFDMENKDRVSAIRFLVKWMSGTPGHSFRMDETATKIAKGNEDVLGIYMAGMVKYTLEHKEEAKDFKQVKLHAIEYVIQYCQDETHKLKMTKNLKKLAEAKEKGTLSSEIE